MIFWKSKKTLELENQIISLKKIAKAKLEENDKLKEDIKKYKSFENHFNILSDTLQPLLIDELKLDRSVEFDIGTLSKEDLASYLQEVSYINNSFAFNNELNYLLKDVQNTLCMKIGKDGLLGLRQLLLFISGLKQRFKTLSFIYDNEILNKNKKEKKSDKLEVITKDRVL